MTLKTGIKISVAVHLAFFLLILGTSKGCGSEGKGSGDTDIGSTEQNNSKDQTKLEKIEDIEKPTEITLVEALPQKDTEGESEAKIRKEIAECTPYFGGVGITHDPFTGKVLTVHKYYPAYDAGLKVGDTILNPYELRGEIGTSVIAHIIRDGISFDLRIVRGRICLKDPS